MVLGVDRTAKKVKRKKDKLPHLVQTLARKAQHLSEAVDNIQFYVDTYKIDTPNIDQQPWRPKRSPYQSGVDRGKQKKDTGALEKLAMSGVALVKIERDADGYSTVKIVVTSDQIYEFRMSPVLAELLTILAEDSGIRNDALVGWKSRSELVRRLSVKNGHALSPQRIRVRISRLRDALDAVGVMKQYVQTNRQLGYRFAVRVKPPLEMGGNLM